MTDSMSMGIEGKLPVRSAQEIRADIRGVVTKREQTLARLAQERAACDKHTDHLLVLLHRELYKVEGAPVYPHLAPVPQQRKKPSKPRATVAERVEAADKAAQNALERFRKVT